MIFKKLSSHVTLFYCLFYTFAVTTTTMQTANAVLQLAFVAVLLALVIFRYRTNEDLKFTITGFKDIYVATVILLGYGLLTFMWSSDSTDTAQGIVQWIIGFSVALLQANCADDEKELNNVIGDLHIYLLVLLVIGWNEMTTGEYSFQVRAEYFLKENDFFNYYPVAGYLNTNNFAYVTTTLYGFALYDIIFGRLSKFKLRFVLLIAETFFYLWLVLNTSSRLALISIVVVVLFLAFYSTQNLKNSKVPIIVCFLLIFVAMAVMLVGESAEFTSGITLSEYFSDMIDNTIHPQTDADENRLKLTIGGMQIFLNYPLGVGVGRSSSYTNDFIEGMSSGMPIHNMFVLILAEFGVIGGAAFYYIFFRTIRSVWKVRLKSTSINMKTGFMLATILNYSLMVICPSNATKFPITFMFFGVWFSFFKVFEKMPDELTLIDKKARNAYAENSGYVLPNTDAENKVGYYDKEAARRDREQYLAHHRQVRNAERVSVKSSRYGEDVKPIFENEDDYEED